MSKKRQAKTTTQAQRKANRENAQKSTGPKTQQGKSQLATHALKHGLTSKKLTLLPWEDPEEYQAHFDEMWHQLEPASAQQRSVAKRIIHNHWRIHRVFAVESMAAEEIYGLELQPQSPTETASYVYLHKVLLRLHRYEAAIRKTIREDEMLYHFLKQQQAQQDAQEAELDEKPAQTGEDQTTPGTGHGPQVPPWLATPQPDQVNPLDQRALGAQPSVFQPGAALPSQAQMETFLKAILSGPLPNSAQTQPKLPPKR